MSNTYTNPETTVPTVSVIMPFFNMERFICESIDSVVQQTYKSWELILVDDGSTDASTNYSRTYAEHYPERIRLAAHPHHQNRGISASMNVGIGMARGEYVAFLDADDVWLSNKLDAQADILRKEPEVDIICGDTQYWYSWSKETANSANDYIPRLRVARDRVVSAATLFEGIFIPGVPLPCTCSVLVRRDLLVRVGGFEEQFHHLFTDQACFAKLFVHSSVYVSSTSLDRYRRHPTSSSQKAKSSGEWATERARFLLWLRSYFDANGVGGDLSRRLDQAIWRMRHPNLARLKDLGQSAWPRLSSIANECRLKRD